MVGCFGTHENCIFGGACTELYRILSCMVSGRAAGCIVAEFSDDEFCAALRSLNFALASTATSLTSFACESSSGSQGQTLLKRAAVWADIAASPAE